VKAGARLAIGTLGLIGWAWWRVESVGQVRSDFIYWSGYDDGNIWRANLDGSGQQSLIRAEESQWFGFGPYWRQNVPG
jgi:hypothetical protein